MFSYKYGTAGFRYHYEEIEKIATRIGKGVGYCLLEQYRRDNLNNKLNPKMGVMITASHNYYKDNGVKLVDREGDMIDALYEDIMVKSVNDRKLDRKYDEVLDEMQKKGVKCEVVVGMDTRFSSSRIKELIMLGLNTVIEERLLIVDDRGLTTTPELHLQTLHSSLDPKEEWSYIQKYTLILDCVLDRLNNNNRYNGRHKVIIDCANGIGAKVMDWIMGDKKMDDIQLINTNTSQYNLLNRNSGSDYVHSNQKFPFGIINNEFCSDLNSSLQSLSIDSTLSIHQKLVENKTEFLGCSFDGDADRIVFWNNDLNSPNDKVWVLDGDHISALILTYILHLITNNSSNSNLRLNIGVIYTAYSNGCFVDYVQSLKDSNSDLNINLELVCTPTGVKYLDAEARKYDIGIYFEANGHGTVVFGDNIDSHSPFHTLKWIFNQTIGDGIANLMGIMYIIGDSSFDLVNSFSDWRTNLFTKREFRLFTIKVKDKNQFKTTYDQTQLIKPDDLQTKIDYLIKSHQVVGKNISSSGDNKIRAFIRPSGTEDILRLYIEADDPSIIPELYDEINEILSEYK